ATPCLPGPAGLAVLDFRSPDVRGPGFSGPVVSDPPATSGDPDRGRMLRLTVRGYGEARQQKARLQELIMAWDAASGPGTDQLRIDAYPSGVVPPDAGGIVHAAPHTTFVISSSRA
ncbi:MAG: hypothetical protein ACRDOD_26125, partial [Streptosporangiaceae bacterium]